MRLKALYERYVIKTLSSMAVGLFATLIVGLILRQLGLLFSDYPVVGNFLVSLGAVATVMMGAGIGVAVALSLGGSRLVVLASVVSGTFGAYASFLTGGTLLVSGDVLLQGPGNPLGALVAVLAGVEAGRIVSQKTSLDIVVTPAVTMIVGCFAGIAVGPGISKLMLLLGEVINYATLQQPFIMGMLIAVIMGMLLTLPISSAAMAIILGLSGISAGAATVGCATQMVGFAVSSYRENGFKGLIAQGLGTSMLQMPNIMLRPLIWLPTILTSAILGPIATTLLHMENSKYGAGMGTAGLVGPLLSFEEMGGSTVVLTKIVFIYFLLPGIISLGISEFMRKKKLIKFGDMKLENL